MKKIIISILIVLMLLLCINACSAEDSFNETLDVGSNGMIADDSGGALSSSGDTLVVDGNGGGDYATISEAVSASTGGETILIKNGEYTESAKISITKPLIFVGESKGGVIIKSTATNGVFETTENGVALSFTNLNFKDISAGNIGTINVGGDSNLDIINCTFDNCKSKYGTMWIKTTGEVNIVNSNILNSKETNTKGATAIYLQGAGNYNIRNTIIDNAQHDSSGFSYGVVYVANNAANATLDNVIIRNCGGNAYAIVYSNGNTTVKNSRIINNTVPGATGNTILRSGKELTVEQTVIVNNTSIGYLIYNNRGSATLNYNYIANNTLDKSIYGEGSTGNSIDADYNYWGSDDEPAGVPVNNWVVGSEGNYKLNNGDELSKEIPSLIPPIDVSDAIFVSVDGDDSNAGSEDAPVATIKKAVELASQGIGKIAVKEGTITENNIELPTDKAITIIGIGNAIIDGNSSSDSIFVMHGGEAEFINLKFRNTRPRYGGAIFINYETGTSRTVVDINVTVEGCSFDNTDATSRGGAIYAWYTSGNLAIRNSNFTNIDSGSWGAVCVGYSSQYGLNVEIKDSIFKNNTANNGAGLYLQASKIDISGSTFINNTAIADSAAVYLYNTTATMNNCVIINNTGGSKGTAIKVSMPSTAPVSSLSITNSIIENNNGKDETLPAIYADLTTLNVSYSSLINDLSVETRTGTGYGYVYGQGIAILNNNWWASKNPRTKVSGANITLDNWVIINAVANASDIVEGDEVSISVDFNHVNTTSGEIQELAGGAISKEFDVHFVVENGSIMPENLKIVNGDVKDAVFTADLGEAVINVICDDLSETIEFNVGPDETYYGVIHVDANNGDDNNCGSVEFPVATLSKAIELAYIEGGSCEIIVHEGTYTGIGYRITKNLTVTGEGKVIIDGEGRGRLFFMNYGDEAGKLELSNLILTGAYHDYGEAIYSFADELVLNNITFVNNPGSGTLIKNYGKMTMVNSSVSDFFGGNVIESSGNGDISIINSTFDNIEITSDGYSNYGVIYVSFGTGVLTIENSTFSNNKARQSVVTVDSYNYDIVVKNSTFVNNSNEIAYGGVIRANKKLTIEDSVFMNNYAFRQGGAVYVGLRGDASITRSVFIDNSVSGDYDGDSIYSSGKLTINYSVLLTGTDKHIIVNGAEENTVNAQYNWWGKNSNPSNLVACEQSEEDPWGDITSYAPVDVSKWVVMDVKSNVSGNRVEFGDKIEFTVDFTNYRTSSSSSLKPLSENIPDLNVKSETRLGSFDANRLATDNGFAKFVYTAGDTAGIDTVTFETRDQRVSFRINISESVVKSNVTVDIRDIDAKKYDSVLVEVNLISENDVNYGNIELYLDDELIATLPVSHSKASTTILVSKDIGVYNLTAKFIDDSGLFVNNQTTVIFNVSGVCELWNSTFFKFFDEDGNLRDEFNENELVFHGDFSGLGVKIINIPRTITITGDNAKIYNMAFALNEDSIQFNNMTLIAERLIVRENSGALILVNGRSVGLRNVVVNYSTPLDVNAFAIFALSADGFNLMDSAIIFDSNIENGTIVTQHALQIRDSSEFVVSGNVINATLPARDVVYTYFFPEREGINQNLVLAVGIQNGDNGLFTQNEINVFTKFANGKYPTLDALMVYDVSNLEISHNNITYLDSVNAGTVAFANAIDLYNFDNITVNYNNVLINTTSGIEAKGTAYPIQATGPYTGLLIDNNNLTSISNGPALGIYSVSYEGEADIAVTNNNIDVSGLAAQDIYTLVSGMEIQNTNAKVYNNTIHVSSVGDYADENALYGISYAQATPNNHTFDIRDNTVYSDGKYAVYLCEAVNSNVTYNTLYAHALTGDDAVNVSGNNNTVINNTPNRCITIEANANVTVVNRNVTIDVVLSEYGAAGIVSININGTDYVGEVDEGRATIVLPVLSAGEYTFDVVYTGDYGTANDSVSFNVTKITPNLTVTPSAESYKYGADAKLTVSLNDENGAGIDGIVFVNVDDVDYNVTLTDGVGYLTISGLETGNYAVNATFNGNEIYNPVSDCDANIVINKSKVVTANVSVEDVVYGNPAILKITDLSDVDGKLLSAFGGYQLVGPVHPYGSIFVRKGEVTVPFNGLPAGNYSIYVVFGNNAGGTYEFENYIVDFTVFKAVADLNVEIFGNNTNVGANKSITTFVDVFNATGKIQYFEGETQIGEDRNINETVDLSDLSEGTHTIIVKYVNDNNYDAEDKVIDLTVLHNKENITIIAEGHTTMVDKNATIDVTLSENDATGSVSIEIDGVEYSSDIDDGIASIVLPLLEAGEYTFNVTYSGDDNYESNSTLVSFAVDKYAVDFTKAKGHPGRWDKNATVDVILSESDASGTVSINVNGTDYSADLIGGKAVIYAPLLPAGVYYFNVTYSGDDKYQNNTVPITFNVNKYYPTMKAIAESVRVDENARVNVTLPDDATGSVTVTVDGVDSTAEVIGGTASVILPVISESGSHDFTVVYSGDDKYRPQTTNVAFNVIKKNLNVKATARTVKMGDNVTVNVVLSETDAAGTVSIDYGGTVYSATVEDGASIIIIPDLPIGQYALTVEYSGDDVYKANNATVTFNVNKQNSALKATARTVHVGDNVTVNIALSSDATGTVTINANGIDYSADVSDGTAVIIIPDLSAGQYALEVKYGGDDKYKARTATVTFNVNKAATTMKATARTVKVGDDVTVNVTLASDASGEVTVNVNDVDYTAVVVDGTASIVVANLSAGQYSLDVKYGGNDKYKNQSTTVKFNVNKYNVKMKVTASYNNEGDFAIISTVLSDDATGSVSVDVNGTEYAASVVDGSALIAVPKLPAGNYALDVKYGGDDKYKEYSVSKELTVNK